MNAIIGQPISRVDGPAKVTGQAIYAAEFNLRNMAYAALVHSTIARGRIERLDATSAEQAPGVLAVISHLNAEHLPYKSLEKRPPVDPKAGEQLHVFQGPEILFVGQPVAVVVAETVEQARAAAALVQVVYYEAAGGDRAAAGSRTAATEASAKAGRSGGSRGDAETAFTEAPVKVDMRCSHEREHHNAMEPHATIAQWDGDHLTLYDKSQWVDNVRSEIAHVFGMPEANIRVVSPFVGGAFGSALRTWPHVTVAALAARRVGRPVRLELTRRELYVSIGYRPRTEQHMQLGANPDGRLLAIMQDAVSPTSVYEEYAERTTDACCAPTPAPMCKRAIAWRDQRQHAMPNARAWSRDRRDGDRDGDGRNGRGAWRWIRSSCGCAIMPSAMRPRVCRGRAKSCGHVIRWRLIVSAGPAGRRSRDRCARGA